MCKRVSSLLILSLIALVSVNAGAANDPNLVGWWSFNDGSGFDSSGFGHSGEIQNGSQVVYDAERGMVLHNHTGGHVDCGGDKNEGDPNTWADIDGSYSIMCWVKVGAEGFEKDWQAIVTKGTKAGGQMILTCVGTDPRVYFRARGLEPSDNDHIYGNTFIDDGSWHHITAVCDYDNASETAILRLYIDGYEEYTSGVAASGEITLSNDPVYIGGSYGQPTVDGDLLIDDVRIYNRAVSESDITSVMAEAIPGDFSGDSLIDISDFSVLGLNWLEGDWTKTSQAGLVGHWDFSGPAGSTVVEDLAGDNDAVIMGGASLDGTGSVQLAGGQSGQYVDLGEGVGEIIGGLSNATFIIDFDWYGNANGTWQKLATFSQPGTVEYAMLTFVSSNEEYMRFQLRHAGHDEQSNSSTPNLLGHHQIAVALNHNYGEFGSVQIYVDGVQKGFHTNVVSSEMKLLGNTIRNYLGKSPYDTGNYFYGSISEFRIYDRYLSADEISNIYNGVAYEEYVPLESPVNLYDDEPANSKVVDFKDFATLADMWMQTIPDITN